MDIYKGTGAFSGIAIGKILYYHKSEYQIRQYEITDVREELNVFRQARARVMEQLTELYEKNCTIQESQAELFLRQKNLLDGKTFQRAIESIIKNEKVNSAYAVMTTRDEMVSTFRTLEEPAIKERLENIREISDRLISELGGISPRIDLGDEPVILVTESITPTELMEMDKDKLMAIVTHHGSDISHAAILAKTMNIPALIGVPVDLEELRTGMEAVVDGFEGKFVVEPGEGVKQQTEAKMREEAEKLKLLQELKGKETVTADGKKVHLYANIGSVGDIAGVLENDAEGIGLFRSEFLYLGKTDFPTEEEQFNAYKQALQLMAGKKVIIRTLDIGADKQVDYFNLGKEENPALGYRAIRICLKQPEIFKTQLRALLRAAVYGNLSVMYPMITSTEEVEQIFAIVEEVKQELDVAEIPYKVPEQGVMIETPAAVMISEDLAQMVDFFSIGTNDLTQYTLAIDRQNEKLDDFYNAHHKAILMMIRMVVENAHKYGKWAGICGELGADLELTDEFMKMGVDELSVAPGMILKLRKRICEFSKN